MHKDLKLIYLRIVLNDSKVVEPNIYSGVIFDIWAMDPEGWTA
jgi:hypothetical protein